MRFSIAVRLIATYCFPLGMLLLFQRHLTWGYSLLAVGLVSYLTLTPAAARGRKILREQRIVLPEDEARSWPYYVLVGGVPVISVLVGGVPVILLIGFALVPSYLEN